MINIALALFFLSTIFFISHSKKAKNQVEYITAGRQTKLFPLICTLVMTEINPMALISMSALGYLVGYKTLWMAFIAFMGPLFAALTTSKKWKNFDSTCVSTLFDKYLGYSVGNVVRIILLFSLLILSSTYVKGIIIFAKVMFPDFSTSISVLIVLLFCTFSVIRKGLNGIIRMDIIGFFLTAIFLSTCLISSYYANFYHQDISTIEINNAILNELTFLPIRYLIALLLLQLIMYSIAPWWGQKIFSANTISTAYKASIYSSLVLGVFYSSVIVSAVLLKKYGIILNDPESAFPMILIAFAPSGLMVFYVISYFYIATTTICGVWSSMLGIITSGFLQKSEEASPKTNYVIWIALGIITYYIALNKIDNVLHAAVLAVMQICSIYFSVIAIFYFRRISKIGSLVSILLSILIGYISFYYLGEQGNYIWYWAIIGIPAMFISGYCLSGYSNVFDLNV